MVVVPTSKDGLLFYLENLLWLEDFSTSLLHPFPHSLLPSLPVRHLETGGKIPLEKVRDACQKI